MFYNNTASLSYSDSERRTNNTTTVQYSYRSVLECCKRSKSTEMAILSRNQFPIIAEPIHKKTIVLHNLTILIQQERLLHEVEQTA